MAAVAAVMAAVITNKRRRKVSCVRIDPRTLFLLLRHARGLHPSIPVGYVRKTSRSITTVYT